MGGLASTAGFCRFCRSQKQAHRHAGNGRAWAELSRALGRPSQ